MRWEWSGPRCRRAPGRTGCWSGSVVVGDDGVPVIVYTSVPATDLDVGRIALATGEPTGGRWTPDPGGPVLSGPPAELGPGALPRPVRLAGRRRVAHGRRRRPGRRAAVALQYSSADLRHWDLDGVLAERPAPARPPGRGGLGVRPVVPAGGRLGAAGVGLGRRRARPWPARSATTMAAGSPPGAGSASPRPTPCTRRPRSSTPLAAGAPSRGCGSRRRGRRWAACCRPLVLGLDGDRVVAGTAARQSHAARGPTARARPGVLSAGPRCSGRSAVPGRRPRVRGGGRGGPWSSPSTVRRGVLHCGRPGERRG